MCEIEMKWNMENREERTMCVSPIQCMFHLSLYQFDTVKHPKKPSSNIKRTRNQIISNNR